MTVTIVKPAPGESGTTWPEKINTALDVIVAAVNAIPSGGSGAASLTPTAVKTSAYTATVGDFIPVDTTSGSVTVTLPSGPADKSQVGIKHVIRGGSNTVTIARGGSDVFNKTGGSTSLTLSLLNQSTVLQYKAAGAVWYVISDDLSLAQLNTQYAPGATPATLSPYSGSRGYDARLDTYNLKSKHLMKTRAGLARAKAGAGTLTIATAGDSTTAGVGAVIGASGWPDWIQAMLNTAGYPRASSFIPGYSNSSDPRVALGSGWASFTFTSNMISNSTNTNAATFTTLACTAVRVHFAGGTSPFTVSIDGGAATTVTAAAGSTNQVWTSGTLANTTHTVAIAAATGGTYIFIQGVSQVFNLTSGVQLFNTAIGGSKMDSEADTTFYSRMPFAASTGADLIILMTEVNDGGLTDPAVYATQLQTAITTAKSNGADLILGTALPPGGGENIVPYTQAIYAAADANDLPVVDFGTRWNNDYGFTNAAGFMFDVLHGTAAGYADYARQMLAAIGVSA